MTRRKQNSKQSILASGSQEVFQITTATPSGSFVGGRLPLIPTFEPGSRLGLLALQFSQYSIVSSRVQFVSQTSTNTSGRLVMAWTFDSLDSNPASCHQLLQIASAKMVPLWKNAVSNMPRNSPEKRRYAVIAGTTFTGLSTSDKQIYLPASLFFGTDGSAQSGLTVGSLIWFYQIRFFNPNLPNSELTAITTIAPELSTSAATAFNQAVPAHEVVEDTD